MTILGSKLTALGALAGTLATTDLLYVVRGGSQYKATVSQLRITASQVSDSTTVGRSLLTAVDAAAAILALGLGDLALLDTIGTSEIDNEAVGTAQMADLAVNTLLLGDGSNRPAAFTTTTVGQSLMAAADAAAVRTAAGLSAGAAVADAAGGATVDAEARTAINALLARLRVHGLISP